MWTEVSRAYFFNSGADEATADNLFMRRYCSIRLSENMARHQIAARNLRNVLCKLSTIAPDLEQATPGWSRTNAHRLMVLFGSGRLKWNTTRSEFSLEIRQPRFGVYGHEGSLYLWTDLKFLFDVEEVNGVKTLDAKFDGYAVADWITWPTTDDGKVYYRHPLIDEQGNWNPQASLNEDSMLAFLIYQIQESLLPSHFVLSEIFGATRTAIGLPEEFEVVFPKLVDDLISPGQAAGGITDEAVVESREKTAINDRVVETRSTLIDSGILTDAIGLESMARSRHSTLELEVDESSDFITDVSKVTGRFYVYALVDPTNESTPFYIGKGFHIRAEQHFRVVRFNETAGQEAAYAEDEGEFIQGGESEIILEAEWVGNEPAKVAMIDELRLAGYTSSDMIRVIARGLSEPAAFAVEALTIKSVYGLAALTNEVAGHHEERFRAHNNWGYINGFDLPVDAHGNLLADPLGDSYVYVLLDPSKSSDDPDYIFYVGKGNGNRLCQHFSEARKGIGQGVARLDRLRQLLSEGYQPKDIGRTVARVNSDALAYVIESFYIKFVVGFGNLTNIQPGYLYGMFRSKNDWERRHGFDIATEVGGSRRQLLHAFLGEGLDTMIYEVMEHPDLDGMFTQKGPAKLIGAGELAVISSVSGVSAPIQLRIQVRCARRIKLFLIPKGTSGRKWMRERFAQLGLISLLRKNDDMFSPPCWSGARNLTDDLDTAVQRAVRLIQFARALQSANTLNDLDEYRELLTSG